MRELPVCTVAVDHEDCDLISYNRQCLHPYYASIRLLCERSPAYCREMTNPQYFQWAFKHIIPYSIQYPQAVQELNKCLELFLSREHVSAVPVTVPPQQFRDAKEADTARTNKKKSVKEARASSNDEELIVDDSSENENNKPVEKVRENLLCLFRVFFFRTEKVAF